MPGYVAVLAQFLGDSRHPSYAIVLRTRTSVMLSKKQIVMLFDRLDACRLFGDI